MSSLNEWRLYKDADEDNSSPWYDMLLNEHGVQWELNLFREYGKWVWYGSSRDDSTVDEAIPEAIAGDVDAMKAYVLAAFRMR
jgi:hypothetical protein